MIQRTTYWSLNLRLNTLGYAFKTSFSRRVQNNQNHKRYKVIKKQVRIFETLTCFTGNIGNTMLVSAIYYS